MDTEKGDACAHMCKQNREDGTIQGSRTSFLIVSLCFIAQSKLHWCLGP